MTERKTVAAKMFSGVPRPSRVATFRGLAMTGPRDAWLSDDSLKAEALSEAHRADIIGTDYPRVTAPVLLQGLVLEVLAGRDDWESVWPGSTH